MLAFLGRTLSFLGRMCNKVMHSNTVYVNVIVVMPFSWKRGWVSAHVGGKNTNTKNEHAFIFVSSCEPLFLSQLNPAHDVNKPLCKMKLSVMCL